MPRAAHVPRHPVHVFMLCASIALALTATGCGRHHTLAPDVGDMSASGSVAAKSFDPAAGTLATTTPGEALHLEGVLGPGALWTIDKPSNWNGDLVVYLHGYSNPADPVGLPNNAEIRAGLLERGFAVAASSYSENGYAVREAVNQSQQLGQIFTSRVALPGRTYLFGQSLGGLVGMILTDRFASQYDGSLLVCGVVGGSDEEVQYIGDIRVLFDAVYGDHVLEGDLEHTPPITNVNAQVIGPALAAINANPQGVGIIQALARRPLPGNSGQEIVTSLLTALAFAMQGGTDLFERAHGHTFFDNADWQYSSPLVPAPIVAGVNAAVARYDATADAQAFLDKYSEPAENVGIPVLAMHTTRDPLVPVWHEDLFAQSTAGPNLLQRRTERYGHCTFSTPELMANFDDLVAWSTTGQKPAL
jgi:pimeloyl-ACP methyl ester carboxylesterase